VTLELIGRVEAAELAGDVFVVSAHGPLDARVAGELRDILVPIAAADGAVVLLDLDDAHGLDTATLGVVGIAAHLVRRRGERMRIVTRSSHTRDMVDECGLSEVVDVLPTLRQALDA
jgi:anti-anti-sigma factor